MRPGDWRCEHCNDHQFERNLACRKCGAPKPTVSSNNQISKAGDWICPNPACGDVQFERNALCRKCNSPRPGVVLAQTQASAMYGAFVTTPRNFMCRECGAPKPKLSSNNQMAKIGDWICPNSSCQEFVEAWTCQECGESHSARTLACPNCGAAKPKFCTNEEASLPEAATPTKPAGGAAVFAPEDWMCQECGDHQFARNLSCRRCGAPKPKVSSNNQAAKKGDWICPNPNCGDVQFEKNATCRRCGTLKPSAFPMGLPPAGRAPAGCGCGALFAAIPGAEVDERQLGSRSWQTQPVRDPPRRLAEQLRGLAAAPGYAAAQAFYAAGTAPLLSNNRQVARPGDWICPNPTCQDVQFERNVTCRKCGSNKPIVASNMQVFKTGDWICPNEACKDVQFERNKTCRKCGSAKPEDEVERTRSRSPS